MTVRAVRLHAIRTSRFPLEKSAPVIDKIVGNPITRKLLCKLMSLIAQIGTFFLEIYESLLYQHHLALKKRDMFAQDSGALDVAEGADEIAESGEKGVE